MSKNQGMILTVKTNLDLSWGRVQSKLDQGFPKRGVFSVKVEDIH